MAPRLAPLRDVPITFAHRGARAHAPENTIEAFRLALKLGLLGLRATCGSPLTVSPSSITMVRSDRSCDDAKFGT